MFRHDYVCENPFINVNITGWDKSPKWHWIVRLVCSIQIEYIYSQCENSFSSFIKKGLSKLKF